MEPKRALNRLPTGETGVILEVRAPREMQRRFLDLGLIPGTSVACVGRSPLGGISAYLIRGAVIAIRDRDCREITVGTGEEHGHERKA